MAVDVEVDLLTELVLAEPPLDAARVLVVLRLAQLSGAEDGAARGLGVVVRLPRGQPSRDLQLAVLSDRELRIPLDADLLEAIFLDLILLLFVPGRDEVVALVDPAAEADAPCTRSLSPAATSKVSSGDPEPRRVMMLTAPASPDEP